MADTPELRLAELRLAIAFIQFWTWQDKGPYLLDYGKPQRAFWRDQVHLQAGAVAALAKK